MPLKDRTDRLHWAPQLLRRVLRSVGQQHMDPALGKWYPKHLESVQALQHSDAP